MGQHAIRLPDVGEGVAEAELVEWLVKVGDLVSEDQTLAAVMTDKATVEIPSPVAGRVTWLHGEPGDKLAVGSEIVHLEVEGAGQPAKAAPAPAAKADTSAAAPAASTAPAPAAAAAPPPAAAKPAAKAPPPRQTGQARLPRAEGEKPLASPAVRQRARDAGVDLRQVSGSGPAGRISHEDLDALFAQGPTPGRAAALQPKTTVNDVKVIGLRRRIAEKMSLAKARIPHITYVEEVDVTALEELRANLNRDKRPEQPKLTLLPFLIRAIVRAVAEHPAVNAIFDDEAGVIHEHGAVHIGIAAQTAAGLMVPVVKHAEALDLWGAAAELGRVVDAAKSGTATREELTGSTITITSLGAIGGIVTTPVINHPEVAIVGVNKIAMRPLWTGAAFVPRQMMNLSSAFDHRVIDGWVAAQFVQRIKALLETPATIFIEG